MRLRHFGRILSLSLLVALGISGCAPAAQEDLPAEGLQESLNVPQTLLLSTATLEQWAGHPDLLILDTRSAEDYREGHLPQALSFPTARTFDVENDNKLPSVGSMEELFGAAGIDETKTVVVYDKGNLRSAARVLWALHVHGHQATAVLEGGLSAWLAGGGEIVQTPTTAHPTSFIAQISPGHLSTLLEVREAIEDPQVMVVDVRSEREYRGDEERWPRNGHIPGARHVEWNLNFESTTHPNWLRNPEAIRELYGLAPGHRAITYCTRGRRAAVAYLALRSAGFEATVYDGSWTEWSSRPDTPIEPSASAETSGKLSEDG